MLRGIDPVMAAGQHRDRAASDAAAMRRLIDAAREARDDDKAGLAKLARQAGPQISSPAPEALREPTIAIIGRISVSSAPRTPSSGGASSMVMSRGG